MQILAATHKFFKKIKCVNLMREHKTLSKNVQSFFNSNFAEFSASNIQVYTELDFETQSVKKI